MSQLHFGGLLMKRIILALAALAGLVLSGGAAYKW
jgi:hypothetical protein